MYIQVELAKWRWSEEDKKNGVRRSNEYCSLEEINKAPSFLGWSDEDFTQFVQIAQETEKLYNKFSRLKDKLVGLFEEFCNSFEKEHVLTFYKKIPADTLDSAKFSVFQLLDQKEYFED